MVLFFKLVSKYEISAHSLHLNHRRLLNRKAENMICGQQQMKKQPTAKEHVEIFLRFKTPVFLFSSIDVAVVATTLSSSCNLNKLTRI